MTEFEVHHLKKCSKICSNWSLLIRCFSLGGDWLGWCLPNILRPNVLGNRGARPGCQVLLVLEFQNCLLRLVRFLPQDLNLTEGHSIEDGVFFRWER